MSSFFSAFLTSAGARRLSDWAGLFSLAMMLALVTLAVVAATADADSSAGAASMDLNRANAEQLAELPGIGEAKAAAIVAHRMESGAFASVDELEKVRGIGPALVTKLRPLVKVGGAGSGAMPAKRSAGTAGAARKAPAASKK